MNAHPTDPPLRRPEGRIVKIDSSDPKAVARTRSLVRLLYIVHENSRRTPLHEIRKHTRFYELETVFAHYWRGIQLPPDDAGRDCLYIAACHLWYLGKRRGPVAAIEAWASIWAPWCGGNELAALIKRVESNPRKWTADQLADELRLPFELRQALGITTIGAFDLDKAGREKRRADMSRGRSAARRQKNGAIPRMEYLAEATSRAKPWGVLGIGRATYYRRKREAKDETSPNAANKGDQMVCADLSQNESHKSQPWSELGISRATYYRQRSIRALAVAAR
jgi:hypothetical protein